MKSRKQDYCQCYREYSYSKMIENRQGPTPDVRIIEVSVTRELTFISWLVDDVPLICTQEGFSKDNHPYRLQTLYQKEVVSVSEKVMRRSGQCKNFSGRIGLSLAKRINLTEMRNTRGREGTHIHYLYGYMPPNGVVILKLLI